MTENHPLILANAGTQVIGRLAPRLWTPDLDIVESFDLGPGVRRDERI